MLRRLALVWLALALALGVGAPRLHGEAVSPARTAPPVLQLQASAPVFPGAEWERVASPEAVGWSSEGLDRARQRLGRLNTKAAMAVVGGRVLLEYGDLAHLSYIASIRKSVLSLLIGIYRERGAIDLDATLEQLGIDDHQALTAAERRATVRHLITSRSGVYHPASNPGDDLASAPPRGSQAPGAYFLYSNWDFNALGTIFEQATGVDVYDAVGAELAVPLGMQDWNRSIQQKSGDARASRHLAYHMVFSTRDMARIGYLMARDGEWDGRQVVPREWVRESTRAVTPRAALNPAWHRNGQFGYGYMWWVFDAPRPPAPYAGAYTAVGAFGQYILVLPKLDLVIAHKTEPVFGKEVATHQFLDLAALIVRARCDPRCPR